MSIANNALRWITSTVFGAGNKISSIEKQDDGSFWYGIAGSRVEMPFHTSFELFRGIPHLRSVIEKKVAFWSNVRFRIERTDTPEPEIDTEHELNTVLANPNAFQSWRQFLVMVGLYKYIAGVAFIYPGFGVSRRAERLAFLKNIDFDSFDADDRSSTQNALTTDNFDDIIRKYTFWMKNGQSLTYKPSELITFKDLFISYSDDFSRITTLLNNKCLENIYKAMIARGIMMDKKGGIGLVSGNQKDGGVSVPLDKPTKDSIKKSLSNYGLGVNKEPIIVTDVPLRFTPFVFPTRELMLFEEIVDDFNQICDIYGMARELFVGDAAYAATRDQAEKDTYENTIVPEWDEFFNLLNVKLNMAQSKRKIVPDVAHIGCLQKSEKENIENQSKKSAMLLAELDKGIITIEEYRQQMGYTAKAS